MDDTFEYLQYMFWLRNKNMILYGLEDFLNVSLYFPTDAILKANDEVSVIMSDYKRKVEGISENGDGTQKGI